MAVEYTFNVTKSDICILSICKASLKINLIITALNSWSHTVRLSQKWSFLKYKIILFVPFFLMSIHLCYSCLNYKKCL